MRSVADILEEAKRLSPRDRRQLVEELEQLDQPAKEPAGADAEGPYARTLALAGTMHSDLTDVSRNKRKHLADIYADKHKNE